MTTFRYEKGYTKKVLKRTTEQGELDDVTVLSAERWAIEKMALVDGALTTESVGVAYAWREWRVGSDGEGDEGDGDGDGGGGGGEEISVEEAVEKQGNVVRELKEGGLHMRYHFIDRCHQASRHFQAIIQPHVLM